MNYLFENQMPVAKSNNLVVEELADEVLVYDESRRQAHCLNTLAAQVWRACDGNHTAQALAQKIGTTTDMVMQVFGQLEEAHLLQAITTNNALPSNGLTRRAMLRRAGVVAAGVVAGAAVSTIVAPTAAQAASLNASGATANDPSQCQSGFLNPDGTCA